MKTGLAEEWRQRFGKRIYDLLIAYQESGKKSASAKKPAADKPAAKEAASKGVRPVPEGKKDAKGVSDQPLARGEYGEGDVIFPRGEPGDTAYLIQSRTVDIIKKAGDAHVVIAQVGQGAIIGEMALIDSEPRMATARAAAKTSVTVIPSKELEIRMERLAKFDPVLRRLVGMMVQRMRDAKFTAADS